MIHIVTDSMSDITPEEAAALNVVLLPLTVRIQDRDYREGVDLSRERFYEILRSCDELPKTSQIPPEGYYSAFCELLRQPEDDILCITGSSKISGCYNSARMAREMLGPADAERVTIVDSLIAISGMALLVRQAALRRPDAKSAAALGQEITFLRDHQRCYGQAGDLKFLVMGGRLSPLVGKVGNTLNLRPMLRFTGGEILQAGLVRGRNKALPWYIEKLEKHPPVENIPITVAGADCPDLAERTADYIRAWLTSQGRTAPEVVTMGVGAVIGTHVGPDLIAVAWIEEQTET